MVLVCYILIGIFFCALLTHAILEIHYFMRMLLVFFLSLFKKKVFILDECTMTGVCLTTDIDLLLFHMNNARYVRELDFARFDFFKRTNLFAKIKSKGGAVVQGGNSIRYRKFIRPFTIYQIRSKYMQCFGDCRQRQISANRLVPLFSEPVLPILTVAGTFSDQILYWDDQNIYMEHRFITPKDDFVRAIALGRHRIMNCNANDVMRELIEKNEGAVEKSAAKPKLPLELAKWIECNEISSSNLRNNL